MTPKDYTEVLSLMADYFKGLYHADSSVLREVFHPKLAYVCATDGDELYLDLETYMARIDQRVSPSVKGDARNDRIQSIAFAGQRLAHVKVRMTLMGRDYADELTLVRDNNAWRIVTKVFSYVPAEA
ncbi:MAG: nuclear transport factor 2 family protein [Cognatishimia sp.]|uniref:nuclear transport factor 2 family protein n=1 Tax=Cognatishimia sp. TaxID=2211648 RepID=UPI003B8C8F43